MTEEIKPAPPGFTDEQWRTFAAEGLLHVENALSEKQVEELLGAVNRYVGGATEKEHTNKVENIIAKHHEFASLIDLETHIGYAYDIFGDQTRLSQNDLFMRPPGSVINHWHFDGPRAVPYRVFSPVLPLKLRIGYWLTDLPREEMGNFVYIPGSHLPDYEAEHAGIDEVAGQKVLTCRKGSMTIFGANLWHRIQPNHSDVTRINVFLSYTPTWVNGYYFQNLEDYPDLTREQRILLRPYGKSQEDFSRPPAQDQPLYLGGLERPAPEPVERHKVRRLTRYEQHLRHL
ncbi:phytanoyl-CoA dioxygenase family protein [Streptomyces sp. IMTB 2501]|uniref:phytanoyl-CoA dioxygenase family protein n=1 Tax=Streptomyces sp. IMTB 2501 TaxID=1776340 RepID=UPI0015BBF436|nr:phytanoyl-CoA dioxygenase family protein [Streptomyces sp. IMTB 2501]